MNISLFLLKVTISTNKVKKYECVIKELVFSNNKKLSKLRTMTVKPVRPCRCTHITQAKPVLHTNMKQSSVNLASVQTWL